MQQEAREGQAEAVFLFRAQENVCAGAGYPAGANHLHTVAYESDHVVDRVARFHMTTRRIDHDADVALALGIGQKLGGHPLGHLHIHFAENQHCARLEESLCDLA